MFAIESPKKHYDHAKGNEITTETPINANPGDDATSSQETIYNT